MAVDCRGRKANLILLGVFIYMNIKIIINNKKNSINIGLNQQISDLLLGKNKWKTENLKPRRGGHSVLVVPQKEMTLISRDVYSSIFNIYIFFLLQSTAFIFFRQPSSYFLGCFLAFLISKSEPNEPKDSCTNANTGDWYV